MAEQEIESQMFKVYEAQQKCLKVQELLAALTFPFYLFGFIPLLLNFLVSFAWGIYLRNKASSLAMTKYPSLGPRRVGSGFSWDPPMIDEAKRRNDNLTVKILRFNYWSLGLVAVSFFVYLFMLTWGSQFITWQIRMVLSR